MITADGPTVDRGRQGAVRQRRGAPRQLHRLDRGRPHPDGAERADGQEALASNWAATRRSSCSTMPTSTAPSKARWSASTATPARPASAPTASTCRTASTTSSSQKFAAKVRSIKVGNGFEAGVQQGPLIDEAALAQGRAPCGRCAGQGRHGAWSAAASIGERSSRPRCWPTPRADMLCAREETFGPVAPVFRFETEAGSHRAGQQHRVRPGQLFLQPRHRPHLPRRRGAGIRHGRHQHRA